MIDIINHTQSGSLSGAVSAIQLNNVKLEVNKKTKLIDYIEENCWRTIPSYPKYEASKSGNIRRKDTKYELNKYSNKKGYLFVSLRHVYTRSVGVHRLVTEAFRGVRPSRKHQAAHFDGNKQNNRWTNLRWATPRENCQDTVRQRVERLIISKFFTAQA